MEKKYYKRLDFIRVLSCIGVLLYHLNILKGGYLAVCTFFVMTGYLSVISGFKNEKFSIKDYYISRIKKVYLPLLIVAFSTIAVISFFESINWINLKPETTSVLLGYNNFWQLNANLDYFVRHISSPFIHLWYIAILLQFEIVFPIIFMIFKKIGKKVDKSIPCLFFLLVSILSYVLFYKTIKDGNIMSAYYGTFTRAFSLLFGVFLGFVHHYYSPLVIKDKILNKVIFSFYLILSIVMFVVMGTKFCSFSISMLVATLLSMRLIDYSIVSGGKSNKIITSLSNISYEIYLVQYPVIFVFQSISLNSVLKTILTIIVTIIISYIIHTALNIKKSKSKVLSIILLIPVLVVSIFGAYKYIVAKDHTEEMHRLEDKLNENQKLIEKQKEEYLAKKKNEEDEWQKELDSLNLGEEELKEKVKNMRIVGIGDSIMELAVKYLYNQFPNGYFDAKTNRTETELNGILKDLKDKDMLPDIIVLNIGTNGSWSKKRKEEMLEIVGDRKIFWLNATKPDYAIFNDYLIEFAESHDNVYIIDWITQAKSDTGLLIYDGVHPTTPKGCKLYAQTIYDAIYNYYLKEYNLIREEKIKEHQELENKKIAFVGNELLLGMYDYLQNDYSDSEFIIDKDFTYKSLKEKLLTKIEDKSLSHNVVLMLDKKIKISKDEYNELFDLLKDYKIYIVDINNKIESNNDNIVAIDFKNEIEKNKDYISFDGVHLTEEGSNSLKRIINESIKKENE